MEEIISFCPVCSDKLTATKLKCYGCGLELSNDFALSKFNYLNKEELNFIDIYLKHSGSLKEVQKQLNISYPSAKKQFNQILHSLGYTSSTPNTILQKDVVLTELPIYADESFTVRAIKTKLNSHNGIAAIPLHRDGSFQIHYEAYGNGIIASNIPSSRILTWKAFDAAIELLRQNNGTASKGQAMKYKLGEKGLTLDTVEGYVAHKAYGIQLGESTLRIISALSAILEWAEVCRNGYGFLSLIKD